MGDIYGRDDVAEEIYATIAGPHRGSVSLIGDRKIGKSTLLHYIADPRTVARHRRMGNIAEKRDDGKALRLFFVQIEATKTRTLTDFHSEVVKQLGRHAEGRAFIADQESGYSLVLESVVQRMEREGARLVIMVDEAEALVTGEEGQADEEFKRRFDASSFTHLKALANNYDVAFVTASEKGLGPVLKGSSNPHVRTAANSFAAQFEKVRVFPLDPDSAEELILEPAWRRGLLEEFQAYQSYVQDMAGRFPLLIQIVCSGLFKHHMKSRSDRALDHAKLERQLMGDADAYFDGIRESLDEEEMQVLVAVIQGTAVSETETFWSLSERGYIEETRDGGPRISSRLLARYLIKNPPPPPKPGAGGRPDQLQIGPWILSEELGKGGIGRVYCGKHEDLDEIRAIKLLDLDHAKDEKFLQQFKNQARLWYGLSERKPHPNIVKMYMLNSSGEYYYLEMELIHGRDLRKWIDEGLLTEDTCLRIAIQIAEAMEHYWTESHLVHRDIKPRNILIDDRADGAAKLSDFDLAVALQNTLAKRNNSGIVGSRDYMAPEQFSCAGDVDIRADIHALGVTIFEAVTGKLPREVTDPDALGISRPLKAVLAKMREKDRENRHRNPAELLEDLYAVQKGECPPHSWESECTTKLF
ncbi:MAG: protein kinase [Planctomycetes bacterium]|nr:protein kinase [Planctomycetota bacterium]